MNVLDRMRGLFSPAILSMLTTWTWSSNSKEDKGILTDTSELFTAAKILEENLSTIPIMINKIVDGEVVKDKEDWRHYLLNRSPSPSRNSQTWRAPMIMRCMMEGNAFSLIKKVKGKTRLIYTTNIDTEHYTLDEETDELFYHYINKNGKEKNKKGEMYDKIHSSKVIHIKFPAYTDPGGIMGDSPAKLLNSVLSTTKAGRETLKNFYNDGARPGMLLKNTVSLTAKEMKNYETQIKNFEEKINGMTNHQKISMIPGNTEPITWSPNIEEAKISDVLKDNKSVVSSLLGLPVFMIGDYDQSKFNSIEYLTKVFHTLTIRPWAAIWRRELEDKLLTDKEWAEGMSIEFNTNSLIELDFATKWDSYQKAIQNDVISPEYVRKLEGFPTPKEDETQFISSNHMIFGLYKENQELKNEKLRIEIENLKKK